MNTQIVTDNHRALALNAILAIGTNNPCEAVEDEYELVDRAEGLALWIATGEPLDYICPECQLAQEQEQALPVIRTGEPVTEVKRCGSK